jgi:MOSC domain-containing protein YiiM
MKLLSVNVAKPRSSPWGDVKLTGIDKRPVGASVMVTAPGAKGTGAVGLAGDRVYDVRHHGGPDQAVYAYAREDLDFWEAELNRPLPNGVFGENLTTAGVDLGGALIGERWRLGPDAILEVCCPRIPCRTFQGWLEQAGWIKRFTQAARSGAYLRVIGAGEIRADDPVRTVHRPGHDVTVAVVFRALTLEPDLLPSLLVADALPEETKELARRRTAHLPRWIRLTVSTRTTCTAMWAGVITASVSSVPDGAASMTGCCHIPASLGRVRSRCRTAFIATGSHSGAGQSSVVPTDFRGPDHAAGSALQLSRRAWVALWALRILVMILSAMVIYTFFPHLGS